MYFQGEFHNSIDAKGRASIPAAFRDLLLSAYGDQSLKLAKSVDGGLRAYPMKVWTRLEEAFAIMAPGPQREAMFRSIISPAVVCTFDPQGRIQMPQSLRSSAGLEKEIVVVGMGDKIEIWSQLKHAEISLRDSLMLKENPQLTYEIGF